MIYISSFAKRIRARKRRLEITFPARGRAKCLKEGAMDYDNRAHRMTDDELEEWNRDPLSFVKGLLIAAAICLAFWAAVVVTFVIF